MNEVPGERADKHDADAPLAHEQSSWFARELSEDWEELEPGIFRYVGPRVSDSAQTFQPANKTSAVPHEDEVLKRKGLKEMSERLLDKARRSPR